MFFESKFTKRAKKAIDFANQWANKLQRDYIGSEDILVGILSTDGFACRILKQNNIVIDDVKRRIYENMPPASEAVNGDMLVELPFTPRASKILSNSCEEAAASKMFEVGTEHILIAMIKEGRNVGVQILVFLGADLKKIFKDLTENTKMMTNENSTFENSFSEFGEGIATNTPNVNKYAIDLTKLAAENKLDPVIGRNEVIQKVIQTLCRKIKNNPCLIGEPGVGKTAIVEALARFVSRGEVPSQLKGKRVVSLDIALMVAGTKYRGQFEERLKRTLTEVKNSSNIIIFIDEIHTIIGAGNGEGAIDAANMLKPSLSRGEIQVIGATTLREYRKHIEKDSAMERRFCPITVTQSTPEDTILILKGIREKYEAHHGVKIDDDAIEAAVTYSTRYISDRFLPDKAIDLIDEASAAVRIKSFSPSENIKIISDKAEELRQKKEKAILSQEFEKAADLRDQEQKMVLQLEAEKKIWSEKNSGQTLKVEREDVAQVIAEWTGIKVTAINEDENKKLMDLENALHKRVIGQDEAVSLISKCIRRSRVGLRDSKRPIGSFVFLGPTGVGKTELSKGLAETVFGSEDALIKIDMSEYMEKHAASKLIGSPPGYVGHEEPGQLTEKVKRRPYSIVLLDEIDKADPEIFNLLLQILEDGHLTDSQGVKVDFRNVIILMTSNLGARLLTGDKKLGFSSLTDEKASHKILKNDIMAEVKRYFRPEFINRVDEFVVFHKLSVEDIEKICRKLINELVLRIDENGIKAEFTKEVVKKIAKDGFDVNYGARPLRRAVQSKLEDLISEKILRSEIKRGDSILVDCINDEIEIKILENQV